MKKILFDTGSSSVSLLAARITAAFILFPHGAQKLFGWFGGYGYTGTMDFFTNVKHIPYIVGLLADRFGDDSQYDRYHPFFSYRIWIFYELVW